MRVDERLNVATITVDFSDDSSIFQAVMFILSNSVAGNANDSKREGSNVLTTKIRMIKILMDYAKYLKSNEQSIIGEKKKGSLGDAKRFLESKMHFVLNGNIF